ncbi:origin of replication complex subunit 1-like isoform X1 [Ananas comosus]|uniref:Origin recognition complex subunit 1 n=1 Tax=Ananas comosus TaxID=4615 RepID=A0A6P5G678_ANACO|nr:origin of replication complex subunit 1-like isoform X1 [Ananas comosus]
MAATPQRSNPKPSPKTPNPSPALPPTPGTSSLRRSIRLLSSPKTPIPDSCPADRPKTPRSKRPLLPIPERFSPVTPNPPESKRRRRSAPEEPKKTRASGGAERRRVYYRKVVYDGGEFAVGDDVYVKRREGAESDAEDPEVEECRICFRVGEGVLIECDDCLGGFHLKCLKPRLRKVPEEDWICGFCAAEKTGKEVERPKPPEGKSLSRTAKEKLLSSDLWAARIESIWKEPDCIYRAKCRWYIIPEETAAGRQPHNLRRELYRTNEISDIEMESVLRHCFVMSPKDFKEASNAGDDVFYCEYEYDIHWHNFKRITDVDDDCEIVAAGKDEDWNISNDSGCDTDDDSEFEEERNMTFSAQKYKSHDMAANSRKGRIFGLQRIGIKKIPEYVRCHKQTDLEKAKATLLLATLPKSLPCRSKEMEEITAFIKGAICDDHCLGRCLYIHGVPGTGKTMCVLTVMRNLKAEVDNGTMRPYCFIEINGLKLASPENIYRSIYEALSGHRVGWKKALHHLNERFSDGVRVGKEDNQPIVLLIDELDLLLTRNQSVLYNILDWPTKPHSKLTVIGIANTMDLPEKLLPRISSRMGIQRLCFGPYNYKQLQEIVSSRLKGIDAFEEQAIEFASRKVAAMSGDARRVLEICKRAAELTDYRLKQCLQSTRHSCSVSNSAKGKDIVGMTDVEAAIQEVFQAPHIQIMKNSSRLGKIMLVAMVHELYKSGLTEITFEKLATVVLSLCYSNREALPGYDTLMKVGCKLGESRVILCEEGTKHRLQKLQLNFPSDDVAFALKDCSELPWLSKYL